MNVLTKPISMIIWKESGNGNMRFGAIIFLIALSMMHVEWSVADLPTMHVEWSVADLPTMHRMVCCGPSPCT